MSEHLSAPAPTQSVPVSEARAERRLIRRAGISLQARLRTADFNDGNFEEVRTTQNASRKAIYFVTRVNRYYKSMRVRVTCPYDPNAGASNMEQIGEVVRVHKRVDGYGVAVALVANGPARMQSASASAAAPTEITQVTSIAASAPSERRCGTRLPFVAPVELVEMRSGSRFQARTSDLSLQGCYVDTLNPLPLGSAVRVQIQRAGVIFDALANVSSRHVGSGMGLVFGEITGAQRTVLKNWLGELSLPPRTVFDNLLPTSHTRAPEADCAVRLVQLLLRKGLVSQSEAREVLRDCKG